MSIDPARFFRWALASALAGALGAPACASSEDVEDGPPSNIGGGGSGGTGTITDGGWQDGTTGGKGGTGGSTGGGGGTGGSTGGSDGGCFPSYEVCDGLDNNCDGTIDDNGQVPSSLCTVPGGSGKCTGTTGCAIETCGADAYDLDKQFANGCECQASPAPVTTGSTCATAIDVGPLSDSAATTVKQQGNIPVAGREIWYAFKATDDVDTAGDEFHVDVRFLVNPSTGYKMDVYRGGCPADSGEPIATGEAEATDWFVDFAKGAATPTCTKTAGCGEGNCKPKASPGATWNECTDDTAEFRVRIFASGPPTCDAFDLELSNGKYKG